MIIQNNIAMIMTTFHDIKMECTNYWLANINKSFNKKKVHDNTLISMQLIYDVAHRVLFSLLNPPAEQAELIPNVKVEF